MIDTTVEGSPGWWLARLARKLDARRPRMQALWDRYEGDAPIPKAYNDNASDNYKEFRRLGRVNFAGKIVESRANRMRMTGIRTAAANDLDGDPVAQRLCDMNSMGVELPETITRMLAMADSYMMIGIGEGNGLDAVSITGEDARQVVTIHDPVRQRVVRAGLKLYHDADLGMDFAYLHICAGMKDAEGLEVTGADSGRVWVATRQRRARSLPVSFNSRGWDWDENRGGEEGQETGIKRVPIIRFRNQHGKGEFEPHVDLLDSLDQGAFEKRVVSAYQAWRQRAVMIPDGADEDEQGKPIDWDELLTADPGATWTMPEKTAFWESALSDLRPQIESLQHDIRVLADVTSTPMRSFHSDAAGGSAEGAASQREDLVFRVEDRIARVSEALRDALSIAFELGGDTTRANREGIEVLFTAPDRRSLSEMADAWSKTTDLPLGARLTDVWGKTPKEVAEIREQMITDAFVKAVADTTSASGEPAAPAA